MYLNQYHKLIYFALTPDSISIQLKTEYHRVRSDVKSALAFAFSMLNVDRSSHHIRLELEGFHAGLHERTPFDPP